MAAALEHLRDERPVALALPRGGVVVGYHVARALGAPLEAIPARKLGAPTQPEFGFGAIAPGDVRVIDESSVHALGLSAEQIDRVVAAEQAEMARREALYRSGAEKIDISGRMVILVDDGLATGGTARAAARAIRQGQPRRLVLAVPVAPPDTVRSMAAEVDEVVCLHAPASFQAVGQWYADFRQTSDDEVIDLLARARQELSDGGAHRLD